MSKYANHRERGELLLAHAGDLSDDDYWRGVADAWWDCDRQPLTRQAWRSLWLADRPGRERVMTEDERAELAALPERVTIYRGVNARNEITGLSWTLDEDLAHWFAGRFDDEDCRVRTGTVLRHRILALFQARRELEVVVLPKHVYAASWEKLDAIRQQAAITAMAAEREALLALAASWRGI